MQHDQSIHSIAAHQHALVARFQLAGLGATPHEVLRLFRSSAWEPLSERVLRHRASPVSQVQHAMAGVLDASPGAMLSHGSAAALWGLPGFSLKTVEVTRGRGVSGHRPTLAIVHEVLAIAPHHVKLLDGVPVSAPARVIFELAGQLHPRKVERALDNGWSRRLYDGRLLQRTLGEMAERGRPGIQLMRGLLAERGPGYVPPASGLELRFEQVLQQHGERPFVRQVDVGGDTWTGRVDYLDPELPLILEINSARYHAALTDARADERRYAKLRDDGFMVVALTDIEVWHEPLVVISKVRDARRLLLQRGAA